MAARGLRRKKSNLTELKIAVVGAPGVGKSALTVRYLTGRYIGEYDRRQENRYKHEGVWDGEPGLFEILDTCPKPGERTLNLTELMQWADGMLLVYSITDHATFHYIRRAKDDLQTDMPMHLVGNKADMVHLRRVNRPEAEFLSKELRCKFSEVSAADQVEQVLDVFNDLCKEVIASKRKSKQSLLERMLNRASPYTRGRSDSSLSKD